MHADSAQLTGSGHARSAQPAQDYALHHDADDRSWGIVADGCSGAGRTDLGARLWALALDARLRQGCTLLDAGLLRDIAPRPPAGAEADDLQATLVAVLATRRDALGFIAGDGALVALKQSGERVIIEHRFTANLPAYPAYLSDPEVQRRFIARSRAEGQRLEVTLTRLDPQGKVLERQVQQPPIDDELRHACCRYDFTPEGPLRALFAITDGYASRPRADAQNTLQALSTVVNPVGRFLRRRLGLLGQRWGEERTFPSDDLSVAGLCWDRLDPET
jgi:hypothetical protein